MFRQVSLLENGSPTFNHIIVSVFTLGPAPLCPSTLPITDFRGELDVAGPFHQNQQVLSTLLYCACRPSTGDELRWEISIPLPTVLSHEL